MSRYTPNYVGCPDLQQHDTNEDYLNKFQAKVSSDLPRSKKMRSSGSKDLLNQPSQAHGISF